MSVETSKEASILRGLALFGATWQLLWLISESGLRTFVGERPTSWPVLLVGISAVAWLALWPSMFGRWSSDRRLGIAHRVIIASLFAAGLGFMVNPTAVGADGWFVGASVVNLAAGLAGLYLPRYSGVVVVVAIVVSEAAAVVVVHQSGLDAEPLSVDLIYPLYALALGLASVASRHALVTSARIEDASSSTLEREQQARFSVEQVDASVSVAETRLHESVLNTLTAIVRGGLRNDQRTTSRLRERAAESAEVLRRLALGADVSGEWSGDITIDARSVIDDLSSTGVHVEVAGVLAPQVDPSDPGYRAMGWAVREVLSNIARHSRAAFVRIEGDVIDGALLDGNAGGTWRVQVTDDGQGFDDSELGFGLRSVVLDGLERAGGRARIASTPGAGTEVLLELPVQAPSDRPVVREAQQSIGPFPAIGLPMVVAFGAFTVFVVGATWQFVQVPAANLAALAVLAVLAAVLLVTLTSRRYAFAPWWIGVVVLVGVPLMARIEILAEATSSPAGDWSSEVGVAFLFIVVATGAWWVAPLAIVSWVVAQEGALGELTQPGTIVIVVAAILGWSLRRTDARTRRLQDDAERERQALAASRQRLAEAGHRYAAVDSAALIDLLRGIARADVDPTEPSVRAECARQERMIRSLMPLHPERIALHRDLVHIAVAAREGDIDLSINVGSDVPVENALRGLDDALALMSLGRAGTSARASTVRSGEHCIFRLVVAVSPQDAGRLPASTEVLDEEAGLVAYEEVCTSEYDKHTPASAQPSTLDLHGSQPDAATGV